MSPRVKTSIAAPPDRVWHIMADVRAWPRWMPTVHRLVPDDPSVPEGTGATYLIEQPHLPPARWTITRWRPGQTFTCETKRLGVIAVVTHEIHSRADETEIEIGVEWVGPLAWVARGTYGMMAKRYLQAEMRALVRRVEGVASPVPDFAASRRIGRIGRPPRLRARVERLP